MCSSLVYALREALDRATERTGVNQLEASGTTLIALTERAQKAYLALQCSSDLKDLPDSEQFPDYDLK